MSYDFTSKKSALQECNGMRRSALKFAASLGAVAGLSRSGLVSAADPSFENPQTEFVFEAYVTVDAAIEIGPSAYGGRRAIPITGGTFEGPRIKGIVLPGGADWQLDRPDGGRIIEAIYMLRTDDGANIIVHNKGLSIPTAEGRKKLARGETLTAADRYLRTVPVFEAPVGPYEWLNQSIFVGTLTSPTSGPRAVYVRVFRVI